MNELEVSLKKVEHEPIANGIVCLTDASFRKRLVPDLCFLKKLYMR